MPKPGERDDVVVVAKAIAKALNAPLPKVAQIMQKYPVKGDKVSPQTKDAIIKEIQALQARTMQDIFKNCGW